MTQSLQQQWRERKGELAAETGVLFYPKGRGRDAIERNYLANCRRLCLPAIIVRRDGKRYERIEIDCDPAGHRMTEATFERVWTFLKAAVVDKHLRADTMTLFGSQSYLTVRRIPIYRTHEMIVELRRTLAADGAMEVTEDGLRLVARLRGHDGNWDYLRSLPAGDYRPELRAAIASQGLKTRTA